MMVSIFHTQFVHVGELSEHSKHASQMDWIYIQIECSAYGDTLLIYEYCERCGLIMSGCDAVPTITTIYCRLNATANLSIHCDLL